MNLDKGRAKPTEVPEDDSLEARMRTLSEMKAEMAEHKKEFRLKTKHLRESIKCLENIITAEVMELGKTVTVGNIQAEYIPQVVITVKREQNDGE